MAVFPGQLRLPVGGTCDGASQSSQFCGAGVENVETVFELGPASRLVEEPPALVEGDAEGDLDTDSGVEPEGGRDTEPEGDGGGDPGIDSADEAGDDAVESVLALGMRGADRLKEVDVEACAAGTPGKPLGVSEVAAMLAMPLTVALIAATATAEAARR
jgi:hypothetical protein